MNDYARREAYGEEARSYLAGLPSDLPVIAAGPATAVLACAAAVERKVRGESFFVSPLVDEPRAVAAQVIAPALLAADRDIDALRHAFDALADDRVWSSMAAEAPFVFVAEDGAAVDARARVLLGLDHPQADASNLVACLARALGVAVAGPVVGSLTSAARSALRDFCALGDALLVRSHAEARRLTALLGRRRRFYGVHPGYASGVPTGFRARRSGPIVVWGPGESAPQLTLLAFALETLKADIVYICRSGSLRGVRGQVVLADRPQEVAAALEAAACVVVASLSDPGASIEVIRLGVPIVATVCSGASEFLEGVCEYEPWNWRSVLAAVSAARACPPPQLRALPSPDDLAGLLRRAGAPHIAHEPLVTVAIPTYNRPQCLVRALDSVARQTYGNIEVIVVNNGDSVDEIVARYPFARLIDNAHNVGPYAAVNAAAGQMRGEFFGWLADDDAYFPDHVARLVAALEASGAVVAHTNTLTRFLEKRGDVERVIGHKIQFDRALDPFTIVCGATMTDGATMCRRTLFDTIGNFDLTIPDSDLDLKIRAAEKYDFIHVDTVTYCWNRTVGETSFGQQNSVVLGLRAVYDRYPSASATIARIRAANIARFEQGASTMYQVPENELAIGWEVEVAAARRNLSAATEPSRASAGARS